MLRLLGYKQHPQALQQKAPAGEPVWDLRVGPAERDKVWDRSWLRRMPFKGPGQVQHTLT